MSARRVGFLGGVLRGGSWESSPEADVDIADLARVGYVNAYMVESIDHLANRKVTLQKPPVDKPFSLCITA